MEKVKISVRDLVSFNVSGGSLGGTIQTSSRAVIGTREHKRIQDSRGEDYLREYSLKTIIERDGITLEVFGRADGIFAKSTPPVIEEIKTTTVNETSEKHLAQVKLYAYMYIIDNALKDIILDSVGIKLLYINIKDGSERVVEELLTKDELTGFFNSYISVYMDYLIGKKRWSDTRDQSLKLLKFPFESFRAGQREFSIAVFRSIRDGGTLFGRAPTGTGKSVATLYPALKSMAEGGCSKIFYLTAKTIGRVTARQTLNLMREKGAKIKSVVLTAKERICINNEYNCSPDVCKYARDYYSRIDKALDGLEGESDFHEENIKEFGDKYKICPFELSLDISTNCDVIVCDYNYVFDLRVHLKRFFDGGKEDYTLLVDEVHNLPDRLKNSYSCRIDREDIPPVISIIKGEFDSVSEKLRSINELLLEYNSEYNNPLTIFEEIPELLIKKLRSFTLSVEKDIISRDFKGKKLLLDWYFNALFFIKLSELYSKGHQFLIINSGGLGITVQIYCNDPSFIATKMLLKSKSHIFFSATLTPIDYFTTLLLNEREYNLIDIPSPFKSENLKLIIRDDIKTTYKERNRYYQEVADSIMNVFDVKKGNYMVFFPSYAYMEEVRKLLNRTVHIQRQHMDENERKEYLGLFEKEDNILSFAIMGGVFGEGIDLVGDKLIGVIIVGVGLPQISIYGDLMKKCFNYNYAYSYPGFNKVMQAVGRVIRHDDDRGIAVLIDSRFNTPLYKNLFPPEWRGYSISSSSENMIVKLKSFWEG